MFNKFRWAKFHFIIAHYGIAIILKKEKEHNVDILHVNAKFHFFFSCLGRVSLVEKVEMKV